MPFKKTIPFRKLLPAADPQGEGSLLDLTKYLLISYSTALDLLAKMLAFDPMDRITVPEALEHPWLASYHDEEDEPNCPETFEKWRKIEELETLDEFREALWNEIEDYRREVRGVNLDLSALPIRTPNIATDTFTKNNDTPKPQFSSEPDAITGAKTELNKEKGVELESQDEEHEKASAPARHSPSPEYFLRRGAPPNATPTDPVVTYARRSSIMQPSRQGSTYNSPLPSAQHLPTYIEGPTHAEPGALGPGSVVFPSQGYVVPARSRTGSIAGGEFTRKLLRTLSTVSIHESAEGLAGGLAGIAPIGKYIVDQQMTEADAPPSEMPREFGIDEASEGEEDDGHGDSPRNKKGKFEL